jgi:hypothetical protein
MSGVSPEDFDAVVQQVAQVKRAVDALERRFDGLETKLDQHIGQADDAMESLDCFTQRIADYYGIDLGKNYE